MFVINLRHLFICAVRTALKNTVLEKKLAVVCAVCDPFPRVRIIRSWLDMPAGMGGICAATHPPPFLFFLPF